MPYPVSAARGHTHPQAAAGNWWEVAGQTCLAAYQAKGAASLAASYVNDDVSALTTAMNAL